jgi:hypothetical protein
MTEFSLLLQAPDREWANQVESVIQRSLGGRGSVTSGVIGEALEEPPEASACFVAGDRTPFIGPPAVRAGGRDLCEG